MYWGEGELQENFEKDALFEEGTDWRNDRKNNEYHSTVPRPFVQDIVAR